jgi:hypothetical protein
VPVFLGSSNPGGVAKVCWNSAKALVDRGNFIEILALGRYWRASSVINTILVHGLEFKITNVIISITQYFLYCFQNKTNLGYKESFHLLYSLYRLNAIKLNYDIVHIHGNNYHMETALSYVRNFL